jgi:hypothetical protein
MTKRLFYCQRIIHFLDIFRRLWDTVNPVYVFVGADGAFGCKCSNTNMLDIWSIV